MGDVCCRFQAGLFDQQSTGMERRKFLKAILKAETEGDEDENDVPDDETVNQMIARSEQEFDMFQNMDIDRRRQEAMVSRRKPRLLEPDEVPPFDNVIDELNQEKSVAEASFGQGKRRRKNVDYSQDLMSDKEWLKSIDEDIEEDELPPQEVSHPMCSASNRVLSVERRLKYYL